jgi:hypothetical protein
MRAASTTTQSDENRCFPVSPAYLKQPRPTRMGRRELTQRTVRGGTHDRHDSYQKTERLAELLPVAQPRKGTNLCFCGWPGAPQHRG